MKKERAPELPPAAPSAKTNIMNDLTHYGWNNILFGQKQISPYKNLMHGRVSVSHKTCYEIVAEDGFYTCELTGNMLYGKTASDYPCTGDWVIFQPVDTGKGLIIDSLPRQKTLYRLKSGTIAEKQAIASFVDKALIVQNHDKHFSVRRIERFMLQMAEENIQPALVVTKTDLDFDKQTVEQSLKHLLDKMPVFYTSIWSPESLEPLRAFVRQGETLVLTGPSGAGKSSLINALCGRQVLQTASISAATGKGKHTSVRRELILMPGSGVLIDTPGVKVFGVTNSDTAALAEVLDIAGLEGQCYFKDCRHINEKGCAVIRAVENGSMEKGIYENYLKLRKEAWHYSSSAHEKRKHEKSFSKMVKNIKKHPPGDG